MLYYFSSTLIYSCKNLSGNLKLPKNRIKAKNEES
jgi:hypothetical protein